MSHITILIWVIFTRVNRYRKEYWDLHHQLYKHLPFLIIFLYKENYEIRRMYNYIVRGHKMKNFIFHLLLPLDDSLFGNVYNQYCNHQQQNMSISLTMIFDNLLLIILVTSRHAFYISNEMLQTRMEMRYLSFSSQTSFCLKKINIEK